MTRGHRGQGTGDRARAFTVLEVVLAVALLSILCSLVFGIFGTLDGVQLRSQRTLAANEVAHRLVLSHLDDDKGMPERSLPIDYGRFKFMYDREVERVQMVLNRKQASSEAPPQALDRFESVTIYIYDAEMVGDYYRPGELVAQLNRIYDPFAPRNPDSANRYWGVESKMMERINGLFQGAPAPSSSPRKKPQ